MEKVLEKRRGRWGKGEGNEVWFKPQFSPTARYGRFSTGYDVRRPVSSLHLGFMYEFSPYQQA
jgi:hypothetical protein